MDRISFLQTMLSTQSTVLASSTQIQLATIQGGAAAIQYELQQEKEREEAANRQKHGGSRKGRSANINRDFEAGYKQLTKDYFSETPRARYNDYQFRRRFRMHRSLFLRIVDDVTEYDNYFVRKCDALGKPGLYPIQKITSALRILAYGAAGDANDEYLRIAESTSLESLDHFTDAVINLYGSEYLRSPNEADIKRLLSNSKERGFPGMLGSLDCMHWEWKNCPTGWKGQYQGKEKVCNTCFHHI
jgi:hypothetical protein